MRDAGLAVYVTDIRTVEGALVSLAQRVEPAAEAGAGGCSASATLAASSAAAIWARMCPIRCRGRWNR